MNLGPIKIGDIVEVDKRGRVFYALVQSSAGDGIHGLRIKPMTAGVGYFSATAREIVGHWRASKATREAHGWAD